MIDFNEVYSALRASSLNTLVGGSDPEEVGNFCSGIVNRYFNIQNDSRILDFGCGPGRVLLSVLRQNPNLNKLVGFDIMDEAIEFCRNNIERSASNASFELISDKNDHYNTHVSGVAGKDIEFIGRKYRNFFNYVYAFSVFTHIDRHDFGRTLKFISDVAQPGGKALITAFLLTPFSRSKIESNTANFRFERPEMSDDGLVFVGDAKDRLAFIAYDLLEAEKMFFDAGLVIEHIEYGSWRGVASATLQDVIVCSKL